MPRERLFYTGSVRIISDPTVTAAEHRAYACVSLHDGMSLMKGKGAGCYASNKRIAALTNLDETTVHKALSNLVRKGYLVRTKSEEDRRMTIYRVTFWTENEWRDDHLNEAEKGGDLTTQLSGRGRKIGGAHASADREIGGERPRENGGNPPSATTHYIPLNGGIGSAHAESDSVETDELNPALDEADTAREIARQLLEADSTKVCSYLGQVDRSLSAGEHVDRATEIETVHALLEGRLSVEVRQWARLVLNKLRIGMRPRAVS